MMASGHGTIAHLLPAGYQGMVSAWLEEDCPTFDHGGFVVGEHMAEAKLLGKSTVCPDSLIVFVPSRVVMLLRGGYYFLLSSLGL